MTILRKVYETVLRWLWPEICPFCGKASSRGICGVCRKELEKLKIHEPRCKGCGKPIAIWSRNIVMTARIHIIIMTAVLRSGFTESRSARLSISQVSQSEKFWSLVCQRNGRAIRCVHQKMESGSDHSDSASSDAEKKKRLQSGADRRLRTWQEARDTGRRIQPLPEDPHKPPEDAGPWGEKSKLKEGLCAWARVCSSANRTAGGRYLHYWKHHGCGGRYFKAGRG